MTLIEFNNFLKENVTDEMFESLVLDCLNVRYLIRGCCIDKNGNKKYTLQDSFVGDEYFLIINLSNATYENLSPDKYIIANKDEETLFCLANHIWDEQPRKVPCNARSLLSFVNILSDNPRAYFNCNYQDFTAKTDAVVQCKYNEHKQYIEELYDRCLTETIKRLIKEKYLLCEKDWNRKTNKIKLTGINGENRVCECYVNAVGCVFFSVKEPYYPLHYYLTDENDIPVFANLIVQVLKEKSTF